MSEERLNSRMQELVAHWVDVNVLPKADDALRKTRRVSKDPEYEEGMRP